MLKLLFRYLIVLQVLFITLTLSRDSVFTHDIHMNNERNKNENTQFYYGVATAAYQIEGASNVDGRGASIWDTFSSIPGNIANNDNGNIADDSYHKIKADIQLIKSMGLNAYRFSISWSRILPLGIDHYNILINEVLLAQLTPFVTLYHWDLPQALEDKYAGWLDGEQIERDFINYADLCFRLYGDRVKHWVTINEPWTMSFMGYGINGVHAPGRCSDREKCKYGDTSTESYIAAHNILNTHAAAVELYRTSYQSSQQGKIGIVLNLDWAEPYTTSSEDIAAAERRREFQLGWFGDPIFSGRYPKSMIQEVGVRLPVFTPAQQKRLLNNYVDFLGLNHYSTRYFSNAPPIPVPVVAATPTIPVSNSSQLSSSSLWLEKKKGSVVDPQQQAGWNADQRTVESKYDSNGVLIGPQAESPWLNIVPWGFYKVLQWVHHRYSESYSNNYHTTFAANTTTQHIEGFTNITMQPLPIYVTENGCDTPNESNLAFPEVLQDHFRINYLSSYLEQLEHSIKEGVNVKGYFAWSLLDNFEWADGYEKRFGIVHVNFSDPGRTRTRKASSYWYANYVAHQHQNLQLQQQQLNMIVRIDTSEVHNNIRKKDLYEDSNTKVISDSSSNSHCSINSVVLCQWIDFLVNTIDNIRKKMMSLYK